MQLIVEGCLGDLALFLIVELDSSQLVAWNLQRLHLAVGPADAYSDWRLGLTDAEVLAGTEVTLVAATTHDSGHLRCGNSVARWRLGVITDQDNSAHGIQVLPGVLQL